MHEIPVDTSFLDKHGLALTLVVVFAGVIAYLFRLLVKSHDETSVQLKKALEDREGSEKMRMTERETHAIEQARWEVERSENDLELAKERQYCEQRIRESAQQQQRDLHELRKEFQSREDELRKESAEAVERMSNAHVQAMEKVATAFQKLYDRVVSSRRRGGG